MYGAAIPSAFAYYFLRSPPADVRSNDLFVHLLTLVIGIRLLITLYEVPSSALVAEITDDYDERTSMLSFRYFFGWGGGTLMATFALAVFLVPADEISIISLSVVIADVVEESELKTKRRSEGVFFAAITFSRKFAQGFGVVSATVILSIAQFPKGVLPGDVDPDTIYTLGLLYAPTRFIVWMLMIGCLKFYRIDREAHEVNLQALRAN